MMVIKLAGRKEWYDAIAAMVERGITFEADNFSGAYTITLTGGY